MYALLFAAHNPGMKASVAWYGQIRPAITPGVRSFGPLEIAEKITCPVLGLYGDADMGIPAADVKEMRQLLTPRKDRRVCALPRSAACILRGLPPSYRPMLPKTPGALRGMV